MRSILIGMMLCIHSILLMAGNTQTDRIDSLYRLMHEHGGNDSLRFELLLELSSAYVHWEKGPKAEAYADSALILAIKMDNPEGRVDGLYLKGMIFRWRGDYPEALEYIQQALELSESLGYSKGYATSLIGMGIIYMDQDNHYKALDYFQKAQIQSEKIGDLPIMSRTLTNIGIILFWLREYEGAIEKYHATLEIDKKLNNKYGIAIAMNNIGEVYLKLGEYQEALEYFRKSLELSRELGCKIEIAHTLMGMGEICFLQTRYAQAEEYYHEAYEIAITTVPRSLTMSSAILRMSALYLETGNLPLALKYAQEGIRMANELSILRKERDGYRLLSDISVRNGDFKSAYGHFIRYKQLNDSISSEDNIKNITTLGLQYQYEKELQEAELLQQKQQVVLESEMRFHKITRNIFIAGFILAASMAFLYFRLLREKREANGLLHIKNREIEEQNEKISLQKEEIQAQRDELSKHKGELEVKIKERTADLSMAKERAEESDRLKTEFLQNMSHEIRTPMNGIIGFADILKSPDLSPEKQSYCLQVIQSSSHQLLQTIEDILEISRLDTKQVNVVEKVTSLNLLLTEQHSVFNFQAEQKGIDLQLKNELSEQEGTIMIDPNKLITILNNLLDNALKYTFEGSVEFGNRIINTPEGKELEIYVMDTGVGIRPENHDSVFLRFSQEEKSLSDKVGGLGLGLSIVKENVELLGGRIFLQSEKEKGTTFTVNLPYKPVHPQDSDMEAAAPTSGVEVAGTDSRLYQIMVVEDEEFNFQFINMILESSDFNLKVIHARDGKEAVEACRNNPNIDFVFMDLKMPEMSGFEATQQIREFRPALPIVAQTAYTSLEEREKALSAGCNDFLSKPLKKQIIISVLSRHLVST
ncbi:MAG: tetratricopeptide repeat protein [Bacteroidota bacterium]